MSELAGKRATYEDLFGIPENMIGEIIDGELIATPRPSRRHAYAASSLGSFVGPPYHLGGGGGPGSWIILDEPEIAMGENILVPDLSGWRRERFPLYDETNWISVVPDWICEVLSPGTVRLDKVKKMGLYAKHGVRHLWLIDPSARTLEVYELVSSRWSVFGIYVDDDNVTAPPFAEVVIELAKLWLGPELEPDQRRT